MRADSAGYPQEAPVISLGSGWVPVPSPIYILLAAWRIRALKLTLNVIAVDFVFTLRAFLEELGSILRKLLITFLCVLTAGCSATVTHRQEDLADKDADKNAIGIRYYENAPYLVIYSDGRGGLKWQIKYLPDQSHIMTATPHVIGGHTEMTLYFQNGVLASASTVGDTTELPKAVIAAVEGAISLLLGDKSRESEIKQKPGFPAPYIYKLIYASGDNGTGTLKFVGHNGNATIQVPVYNLPPNP